MLLSTEVSIPALRMPGLDLPILNVCLGLAPEAGAEGLPSVLLAGSSTADCPILLWVILPLSSFIKELLCARASLGPFLLQSSVLPALETHPLGLVFLPAFCPTDSLGAL